MVWRRCTDKEPGTVLFERLYMLQDSMPAHLLDVDLVQAIVSQESVVNDSRVAEDALLMLLKGTTHQR